MSSTAGFGRHCVLPLLPEFASLYPAIEVDLSLDDAMSDLVHDRKEIAIRNGRLNDHNIVARQIAPMRLIVCGSPEYLQSIPNP